MTKPLLPALAVLLSLAGCAAFHPPQAEPGTPLRACQDAADANPVLDNFVRKDPRASNPNDFYDLYLAKRQELVNDCMAVRSGRPRGGVQKVL